MTHIIRKFAQWIVTVAVLATCVSAQVAVQLSPMPRLQFFTANGTPCSGCKLYSYAAGTATPQATYLDSSGTTQNSNPITLDSVGSASVWLASLSYKLVLYDTNSNLLFSVDNIRPNDQTYLRLDFTNGPVTGNGNFTGTVGLLGGGTFGGSFGGSPTATGNWSFSGNPTFTGSPTFNKWTSLTTAPAQSGSLRLANTDAICWRNSANSADLCQQFNSMGQLQLPNIVSTSANPAQSGFIGLASADTINWRNAANTGDIPLGHDSSDDLTWNGNVIATPTGSPALRYSATVPASVSNSSSQTTLESVTYAAGAINVVGRTFTGDASVYYSNTSGGSSTVQVQVYLGSTSLCSQTYSPANNATAAVNIHLSGVVTAASASGSIEYGCTFAAGSSAIAALNTGSSGSATVNTTSAQAISVQVTLGTASSNLTANNHVLNLFIQ